MREWQDQEMRGSEVKVRSGWNSEYARKKYDVEVDEADLARIITAAGMPMEALSIVTLGDAHNLLWYSAETLARQALVSFDPSLRAKLTEEARELVQKRKDLVLKIRSQWEAIAELHEAHKGDGNAETRGGQHQRGLADTEPNPGFPPQEK
jgi:hypothetical protein